MINLIDKIRLHNFKGFNEQVITFNKGRNILIGENGVGKSSVLLAISCVLSGSYSTIEKIGLHNLFNINAINDFMRGDKTFGKLPVMEIELFITEEIINHEINGKKNSTNQEKNGLSLHVSPNEEYSDLIKESLESTNIFPFEYYKVEFSTFSGRSYSIYKKYPNYIKYSYLDSSRVNSSYAMKDYIKRIYESKTDRTLRQKINNRYRDITQQFSVDLYSEFDLKPIDDIKIKLNTENENSFQDNITVEKSGIIIQNLGQGEKMFINTDFLLSNAKEESEIILIEEPENHLSYLNMHKLIDKVISAGNEKQTFIATHSNIAASRLDLQNAIFFSEDSIMNLNELEKETANFFKKAPDNNVLNFILSRKAILVEGDAEYILLNEFYNYLIGDEPYNDDISIISCGGKTFKRYLKIAKLLNKKVVVITDNDHDYEKNITNNYSDFESENVEIFADKDNLKHTFEVSLYENNISFINNYLATGSMTNGVQNFMLANKAESAFRLLCLFSDKNPNTSIEKFQIPPYIKESIKWITN